MIERELAATALFADLPAPVLRDLAESSTTMQLKTGEILFRRGDEGDALYVVTQGLLRVVIGNAEAGNSLDTVGPGEWVGELSVLQGGRRSASVLCVNESVVIRVPVEACQKLVFAQPAAKAQFFKAVTWRQPSHHLRASPLFAELAPEVLRTLDHKAQWIRLKAGNILCRAGDVADAVFVVVYGSLEVLIPSPDGHRLVDTIGRGASIGEMGTLDGLPRSATVQALRDSELVRIPATEFHTLLDEQPTTAKKLAHALSVRLRQTTWRQRTNRTVRTLAVVAADGRPLPTEFLPSLAAALAELIGEVTRVDVAAVDRQFGPGTAALDFDDPASDRLNGWLNAQESASPLLIYDGDVDQPVWVSRAIRQADLVIMVARGEVNPSEMRLPEVVAAGSKPARARRELVLIHPAGTVCPTGTNRWLKACDVAKHHHLRAGEAADYARLARSVLGRATGAVLSGGGARGFSHIGALQALRDRGMAVDLIGGTSMGAVIAAQAAVGWTTETMVERNRKAFVECPVIGDFTFPFVSLMSGRSTVNLLEGMFADLEIEDLWLPYFCVSTNLSRAEVVVHVTGPLRHWLRASCSVPGIGPPVPCGGDLLVDGGVLNNLPADIMRQRCAGLVIAMDAGSSVDLTTTVENCTWMSGWPHLWRLLNRWSKTPAFPNVFEILLRTTSMSSDQSLEQVKKEADLYLHPELDSIPTLSWASIDRAVELGYRHACERIDQWQANLPNKKHDYE